MPALVIKPVEQFNSWPLIVYYIKVSESSVYRPSSKRQARDLSSKYKMCENLFLLHII